MRQPAVYILASRRQGTLYIGVTSDLVKRTGQHRDPVVESFSSRYGVRLLVYIELHEQMSSAILREKQLKKWNRDWKIGLIEKWNPTWRDLWPTILGMPGAPEYLYPSVIPAKAGIHPGSEHPRCDEEHAT